MIFATGAALYIIGWICEEYGASKNEYWLLRGTLFDYPRNKTERVGVALKLIGAGALLLSVCIFLYRFMP